MEGPLLDTTRVLLPKTKECRAHYSDRQAICRLIQVLRQTLVSARLSYSDIIVLCIGTDRSTGDALGPLLGSKLKERLSCPQRVYGTLDNPVHATNLHSIITYIKTQYSNPYIIAVDACLGKIESVGSVTLGQGPLKPGAGVHKDLPAIGHIHLTGVVNVGGFMEYVVLQNTRLALVMKLSECIADILSRVIT